MQDLEVIVDASKAAAVLDPIRSRLLAELAEPASAAALAARLGVPRQNMNYHLRVLREHGLIEPAEERLWGGVTERLFVASAASYVISPAAIGRAAVDPERGVDRLSASYLIALGARIVREVGELWNRAQAERKRLATLSMDLEVRFKSAADRAAFTKELTATITSLAAKYHDTTSEGGRAHRVVVAAHPLPSTETSSKARH